MLVSEIIQYLSRDLINIYLLGDVLAIEGNRLPIWMTVGKVIYVN